MPQASNPQPVLSPEKVRERAKRIEEIGRRYKKELTKFQRSQRELLERFIQELEKRKMEEIKKLIK